MEENQEKNEDQLYPQSDPSGQPQPEMTGQPVESPQPEQAPPRQTQEQAFAEVRQSLREEEEQRKPGFFERLFKRGRGKKEPARETVEPPPLIGWEPEVRLPRPASEARVDGETPPESEIPARPVPIPSMFARPVPEETPVVEDKDIPEDEIDNAVDRAMRAIRGMPKEEPIRKSIVTPTAPVQEEIPAAQRRSILTNLRGEDTKDQVEDVESIRQGALEDYTAEPEESAAAPQTSFRQSVKRGWRDMRPLERRMLVTSLIVILAATLIGTGALAVRSIMPTPPPATPTMGAQPYPLSVILPGNIAFPLNRGSVQDGAWNPSGAEWLQGTEVCRWISLPWSEQLEAVLRTLKTDDMVSLYMSNADSLNFNVKSINQIPVDQIGSLASQEEPCILLFLSEEDSDTRWVVRGVPQE